MGTVAGEITGGFVGLNGLMILMVAGPISTGRQIPVPDVAVTFQHTLFAVHGLMFGG
jgi:hypothetical protein